MSKCIEMVPYEDEHITERNRCLLFAVVFASSSSSHPARLRSSSLWVSVLSFTFTQCCYSLLSTCRPSVTRWAVGCKFSFRFGPKRRGLLPWKRDEHPLKEEPPNREVRTRSMNQLFRNIMWCCAVAGLSVTFYITVFWNDALCVTQNIFQQVL